MSDPHRIQAIKNLLSSLNQAGIRDRRVLEAIAAVPRERFVSPDLIPRAWENRALPIGNEQTISQPLVVAMMTQALRLTGTEKVLEVGTGSGYQTAILCRLARFVYSVERITTLAAQARARLHELACNNVRIEVGDGSQGLASEAPFDRIIVTAAAPNIPPDLAGQLSNEDGARLVIPIGSREEQELIVIERRDGRLQQRSLGPVRFVPLIGDEGYDKERDRD